MVPAAQLSSALVGSFSLVFAALGFFLVLGDGLYFQ